MAVAIEEQRHLRDYLRIARRRRTLLLVIPLAVLASGVVVTVLQKPVYESRASLLVREQTSELYTYGASTAAGLQTELQVLSSEPIASAVRERLGRTAPIQAAQVGESSIIAITARQRRASEAARVANAYADAYVAFRRQNAVDDLLNAGQELQARVDALQAQADALDPASAPRQRDGLIAQIAVLKQRIDQLQVAAEFRTGGIRVMTRAGVPSSPVSPRPLRNIAGGLGVGLILAVAVALLVDHLDDTIDDDADVRRAGVDLPVLATIPATPASPERSRGPTPSIADSTSAASEAYRGLRTSLQFLAADRPMRTIQVTSASSLEGKTTTVANLAVALARAGQRVIAVDCDLRRPQLHQVFGVSDAVGLTSVLVDDVPLVDALQEVPGSEGLAVLPSGPAVSNPSELLASRGPVEILTALQASADIVLVDCPPVLPVTDAVVLSGRVDATLLAAMVGTTTNSRLARAVQVLRQVDAPVAGLVLIGTADEHGYAQTPLRQAASPDRTEHLPR